MEELSPLFQEIEFHERWRGYDPDEVDAYVDRVARAAASLRGRLTELQQRAEAAEARAGSGAAIIAPTEGEETLTRTLVLAQRTADAAIAEAREEADSLTVVATTSAQAILAEAEAEAEMTLTEARSEAASTIKDGEDHASVVRAEAETDRRRMIEDAEQEAASAAALERERLAAEVSELQDYRGFLCDDIEILERHVADERHQLTASLSALNQLLDNPELFRTSRAPETSGIEVDPEILEGTEPPGEDVAVSAEVDGGQTIDLIAADAPIVAHDENADEYDDEVEPVELIEAEIDLDRTEADEEVPRPDEPVAEVVYAAAEVSPPRLVTAADLDTMRQTGSRIGFESSSIDTPPVAEAATDASVSGPVEIVDPGPPTAPVPAVDAPSLFSQSEMVADDPFLTQLRDAVESEPVPEGNDEALTAFFDHEEDDSGRSWFGRRR